MICALTVCYAHDTVTIISLNQVHHTCSNSHIIKQIFKMNNLVDACQSVCILFTNHADLTLM